MPTIARRTFLASAALVGLALATGVGCNKDLQKNTDVLLESLEKGDYKALKAVSGKKLIDDLDEDKFLQMSAVYQMLGKLKDKTRTGTGVRNGTSYINYKLDFELGEVELDVVSNEKDVLDGFEFKGDTWKKAVGVLLKDRLGKLLDAFEKKDKAAIGNLLMGEAKADFDAGKVNPDFSALGARKEVTAVDEEAGKFTAQYEKGSLAITFQLKAGKVSFFKFEEK